MTPILVAAAVGLFVTLLAQLFFHLLLFGTVLVVLSIAELMGKAIRNIHEEASVTSLFV